MSILFTPGTIGEVKVENRFVHSATYECMVARNGEIKEEIIERYRNLARGEVGLIITGHMYVHLLGRAGGRQVGIYTDEMIPGLKRVVDAVHNEGGKIVFQIAHAGRQTRKRLIGETPIGPSTLCRDPVFFVKPREMTEEDINEVIESFGNAAYRAAEAGADGIQLHAAHGYLISQFLSPFFNKRSDAWGGSDENRFRFLREIVLTIKREFPRDRAILIKINAHDYTPEEGVTHSLAAKYAKWLSDLGIDGIEISCGTGSYSFLSMSRGDVPVNEFVSGLPWWMKYPARRMLKKIAGKYKFEEAYNLEGARKIKPVTGDVPIILVGGLRNLSQMEETVDNGYADFISLSRPLIREPFLVKKFKEGDTESASCVSCNKCLAAVANNRPLRCYFSSGTAAN